MWQFSIFIGNRRKHKTTDIWRCANEDQCVLDKTGCSCWTTTRRVRFARHGCWCCACRSSSPMLHESNCRIPSKTHIPCKPLVAITRTSAARGSELPVLRDMLPTIISSKFKPDAVVLQCERNGIANGYPWPKWCNNWTPLSTMERDIAPTLTLLLTKSRPEGFSIVLKL